MRGIKELSDWRGMTLAGVQILIKQAGPEVDRGVEVERGSDVVARQNDPPVRRYKKSGENDLHQGHFVQTPSSLFNSSLEGNTGVINFHEDDKIDVANCEILSPRANQKLLKQLSRTFFENRRLNPWIQTLLWSQRSQRFFLSQTINCKRLATSHSMKVGSQHATIIPPGLVPPGPL